MQFFSPLFQTAFRASRLALIRAVGVLICLVASLAFSTAANSQTFINFGGTPALVSGTALQQGAVYRYTAVLPGIDAVVTLAQFASTTVAAVINIFMNAKGSTTEKCQSKMTTAIDDAIHHSNAWSHPLR